jgi:MFS family permease
MAAMTQPTEPTEPTQHPEPTEATLRSLAPSVLLPATLYEIGNGAVIPVIALTAIDLGASTGAAGFMMVLLGVGQVLGDLPASAVADRLGDRRSMLGAASLSVVSMLACYMARSVVVLGGALLLMGVCNATFYLARQSYLTEVAPVQLRARAMSTLGGAHRVGLFVGPFVGAVAIGIGGLRSAYLVAVGSALAVGLALLLIPDVEVPAHAAAVRGLVTTREVLGAHRRLFATLGLAVVGVGAVRAARQTVLPLWAEHLGLGAQTTSLVFGVAGAVEMVLFYPGGKVMDRYGRLAVAVPSMVIMGLSMMALPLTRGVAGLTAVAVLLGIGNGLGSGIMMTLGADAAPVEGRIRFFGIWRVLADSGNAAGPVVVSILAIVATLAAGIVSVGSLGLLTAVAMARWVPRYSRYATRSAVREMVTQPRQP